MLSTTGRTRTVYSPLDGAPLAEVPQSSSADVETAFATYTSGSSWVNHRDDAGRIAVGAVADLVVLDRDPFETPDEIGAARVRSTWIDGECVFEA